MYNLRYLYLGAFLIYGFLIFKAAEIAYKPNMPVVVFAPVSMSSKPELSDASIWLAVKRYNIKLPPNLKSLSLDRKLSDRGSTALRYSLLSDLSPARVTIGPAAFDSWGKLGSTIAHELEIHCLQSPGRISFIELIGGNGVNWAEEVAYLHEIKNAKRFGLSANEVADIKETLTMFHDIKDSQRVGFKGRLGRLAAKYQTIEGGE